MIDIERLNQEWIETVSKANRKADKIFVEKVIRAFLLLEGLSMANIPFVFKGGTSLMLLTNSSRRLSVDIDIIIPESIENLDVRLEHIVSTQGFVRIVPQDRNSSTLVPKKHYKFFYNPIHRTSQEEEYILLDILFEQTPYANISKRAIESRFIPMRNPRIEVSVPSAEDLLGDKLTAFAPNTTGIPYYKHDNSMGMEIIKQLYDIGCLFDISSNMAVIRSTFERIAQAEISYRDEAMNYSDVLEDIFQTSLCLSSRGAIGRGNFEELQSGIKRVKSFIFSEPYHIENAIVSASKAAYLASLISTSTDKKEKYTDPMQVKDWLITNPEYNKLNGLKRTNTEAFFYWYKATENRERMV
ncbi:MAG: nucleotidyl transferase AbiEii/AbiGii toxin family protein [Bacteroidales bacterium]|nr:nucleotidyl transferase AbiEii/AbiGii toxin family protein [Bacteroidales bacterium]